MIEDLIWIQAQFPILAASFVMAFGLLIGSFLNVVIFRTPVLIDYHSRNEATDFLEFEIENQPDNHTLKAAINSIRQALIGDKPFGIAWPGSHCPKCKHQIRAWENIPVISFLFLRGRCSGCQTSISLRYPIVELTTGILSVIVIQKFGLTLAGASALGFTYALIALAMIDYDTTLLPDDITLPLLWGGLILAIFSVHADLQSAVIGAVFGYLSLWSVFQAFKIVTGKDGMGYGDFKLLGALGAWMGWQVLPLVIILSSLAGSIIGGALIAFGRDKNIPIPFGPYLAIAGWIAMMWGDVITTQYLQLMHFE